MWNNDEKEINTETSNNDWVQEMYNEYSRLKYLEDQANRLNEDLQNMSVLNYYYSASNYDVQFETSKETYRDWTYKRHLLTRDSRIEPDDELLRAIIEQWIMRISHDTKEKFGNYSKINVEVYVNKSMTDRDYPNLGCWWDYNHVECY